MAEITPEKIQRNKVRLYDLLSLIKPYYEQTKNIDNPKNKFIKILKYVNDGYDGPSLFKSKLQRIILELFSGTDLNGQEIENITNNSNPVIPENELKLIKNILKSLDKNFGSFVSYAEDRYNVDLEMTEKYSNKMYNNLYDLINIILNNTQVLKDTYNSLNGTRNLSKFGNNSYGKKTINVAKINEKYNNEGLINTNTVRNLNSFSKINGLDIGMCYDPISTDEIPIDDTYTKLYIVDNRNRITRIFCIDKDSFSQLFDDNSNIFYRCKDSVRDGALMIGWKDVINKKIRRIALEFGIYVYQGDLNDLSFSKGRSYILQPTNEVVGRLASQSVIEGRSVVGALHCQRTSGTDYIYSVREYEPLFGGARSKRKTRRIKKYRNKKTRKNN